MSTEVRVRPVADDGDFGDIRTMANGEVQEGARAGIRHWLVAPCLFLTFMLGPFGLLLFLAVRALRGRRAPA